MRKVAQKKLLHWIRSGEPLVVSGSFSTVLRCICSNHSSSASSGETKMRWVVVRYSVPTLKQNISSLKPTY